MAGRINWATVRVRATMQRQGIEDARAELPDLMSPLIRRRASSGRRKRLSKAELRDFGAIAIAKFMAKKNGEA